MGGQRSALRGLGDVSREGIAGGSGSPVCVANQRMVRADHTALRRWRKDVAPAGNTAGRTASARASEGREQQVRLRCVCRNRQATDHTSVYDGTQHPWEFKRVWHLEPSLNDPDTVTPGWKTPPFFARRTAGRTGRSSRPARHGTAPNGSRARRHVPAHHHS